MPVHLTDIPQNATITIPLPEDVVLRIKEKGLIIANYKWFNSFLPTSLSYNDFIRKDNGLALYPLPKLQKLLEGQLKTSTQILSIQPDTLSFYYVSENTKRVPVVFNGKAEAAQQYQITSITLSPDTVTVYAPKAIGDTLSAIPTQYIELDNLKDSVNMSIGISPIKGIKYIPQEVTLKVKAQPFTQNSFEIPIKGENFPKDRYLRTFPAKVKVTFNVDLSHFNTITPDDFEVVVDYNELKQGTAQRATVKIKKQPKGVSQLRLLPTELDYLIEKYSNNDN